jgi:hypothetical protein
MEGSFFKDTPYIAAQINTSQALTSYPVALPFGAQKNPRVMISAGYPRKPTKKQRQVSKIS